MPDTLFGWKDIDDVFSYRTSRDVKIRDRKLCIGRLLIIVAIFFYVVIWSVIVEQGYLLRDVPMGSIRVSLRNPKEMEFRSYCGAVPTTVNGLKYGTLPCRKWDYHDAVYPAAEEFSVLLSTRVKMTTERTTDQSCYLNMNECKSTVNSEEEEFYVADVERYTLLLQHAFFGEKSDVRQRENQMKKGELLTADGEDEIRDFGDPIDTDDDDNANVASDGRIGDIMSIAEILSAAEINLNSKSLVTTNETWRYSGVVILVFINYRSVMLSRSDLSYTYRMIQLSTEFKHEQVMWSRDSAGVERRILNRHGVRLVFVQGGFVGEFNFNELLKTLVTAGAFMWISRLFVDRVLLKVLPGKELYQHYKYIRTVDFSNVTKNGKHDYTVVDNTGKHPPFKMEAHDFVYGTTLRGGYHHEAEWDMGAGPEHAARENPTTWSNQPSHDGRNQYASLNTSAGSPYTFDQTVYASPSPPGGNEGAPTPMYVHHPVESYSPKVHGPPTPPTVQYHPIPPGVGYRSGSPPTTTVPARSGTPPVPFSAGALYYSPHNTAYDYYNQYGIKEM